MGDKTKLGLAILLSAAILGILSDLLLRAIPWGLNVPLWILSFVALAVALMSRSGSVFSWESRWLAVPLLLFAALFVWRDSDTLAVLNGLAVVVSISLFAVRSTSGRLAISGISDYLYRGMQAIAFASAGILPTVIRDIQWRELRGGGYAPLFSVLRGIAISAPLLLVFGALFVAADAVFEDIVSNLFDFDLAEIFGHLVLFGFVAWISAGLLHAAVTGERLPQPPERPAFLSLGIVEIGVVLGLLNALFLAFVLVQARYFFGGASRVLSSNGLTYAEYARRGFFELVVVAALVIPILLIAHWLLIPEKPRHAILFRSLAGTLVGLLLIVMASALQRMRLYTAEFGLTESRLYTTAFMLWMLVVLILVVLTVLRDRRDLFASGALLGGFLAIVILNALNPDNLIVRTNVARLERGEEFDAAYLASLSADAVPALAAAPPTVGDKRLPDELRYTNDGQEKISQGPTLQKAVERRWKDPETDWRTFNISRHQASRIID